MREAPDVPASALVRRTGKLPPEVQRFAHIRNVRPDPRARCQVCQDEPAEDLALVVFEPVIDPSNGQRITVALCFYCLTRGLQIFSEPLPLRPRRRRRTAGKR